MGRKDTVWGARHVKEEEEIKRIIQYYESIGINNVTKLEASAVQAMRSQDVFWNQKKAKDAVARLRGIN